RLSPIGNPTDSPVVRINWKFYRKELLLLIYEEDNFENKKESTFLSLLFCLILFQVGCSEAAK
ncbi:hypothetical protein ABH966_001633, partial [Lysinibacillus sp. RC46]|uniref:hypothetical protein n=1 Tax=Lysinibacillus sp. RC46 TaxID=3156295 RepID=UPI003515CE76